MDIKNRIKDGIYVKTLCYDLVDSTEPYYYQTKNVELQEAFVLDVRENAAGVKIAHIQFMNGIIQRIIVSDNLIITHE